MSRIGVLMLGLLIFQPLSAQNADEILARVDQNLSAKNRVMESEMTIHGRRSSRTLTAKSYAEGTKKSFTEYLSPITEKGTKMLKLEGRLWIYSPSTDRTIQISGHLLRQSVMGSDLSYEDLMDDRKLTEIYRAGLVGEEQVGERLAWVLELTAVVEDVAYAKQKLWIDRERFVPLKQELYAKSGKQLKSVLYQDVRKIEGRWFPCSYLYKDLLKQGKGTEFKILSIAFDQSIPGFIFTKAALKQ